MDYNILLDMVITLGCQLSMCGAETYRIEESVRRIASAYGCDAEVFSIPNCLHVSIQSPGIAPLTGMRRISCHKNDLDGVEKLSNLSRRICTERPPVQDALQWIRASAANRSTYSLPVYLLGNFLGAGGFAVLFGGRLIDCFFAGLCGTVVGLINRFMEKQKANQIFRIILAAFIMAVLAYFTDFLGIPINPDAVIIGALMILVPGLLFINAMRDIIYGDTNSGTNRIVQVMLIAAAIVLGIAVAWNVTASLWGAPNDIATVTNPLWLEVLGCFIGCMGFSIVFNIHGFGAYLCALGGVIAWIVFRITANWVSGRIAACFIATLTISFYSEIMARIRKFPAISYLVVSIFPLLPGAGIYRTMTYAVRGEMTAFANTGLYTAATAGIMAVGILFASTISRLIANRLLRRK